jgi:serine/threonine protein kinase
MLTIPLSNAYFSEGGFRTAYAVDFPLGNTTETVVFKEFTEECELDEKRLNFVRTEAVVMEALSAAPEIVDIFAYCQLSVLVENIPLGDMKKIAVREQKRANVTLNDRDDVDPQNNFTLTQKIRYALDMAKGVEVLHSIGYVHDDLKLAQFLLTSGDRLLLNDFNRAKKLVWNTTKQGYDKYTNNAVRHGDVSSHYRVDVLCSDFLQEDSCFPYSF